MVYVYKVGFHPTFSALGRVSKLPLLSLNENVLKSAISRQAKASKLSLVLWLNEIVRYLVIIFISLAAVRRGLSMHIRSTSCR